MNISMMSGVENRLERQYEKYHGREGKGVQSTADVSTFALDATVHENLQNSLGTGRIMFRIFADCRWTSRALTN